MDELFGDEVEPDIFFKYIVALVRINSLRWKDDIWDKNYFTENYPCIGQRIPPGSDKSKPQEIKKKIV